MASHSARCLRRSTPRSSNRATTAPPSAATRSPRPAGAYVVRQLVEGGVLENAKARGEQLSQRLAGLEDRHPLAIGEDGGGLLRRLELAEDVAGDVVTRARENGLLLNPVRPNRVRFMPPLNVTEAEIDQAVDIVEAALADLESNLTATGGPGTASAPGGLTRLGG